jgi:salicylate hydroxylase
MVEAPVLVAGAGIAGLTAALAFARAGSPVHVVERAPALEEAGAGIQLSPNATRRLFGLGLEDALRAVCVQPEAVVLRDARTLRERSRVRLGAWGEKRWGAPYLTCHRADLQRALLDAAEAIRRVTLTTGAAVTGLRQTEGGVALTLESGEAAEGRFLVGADGAHSAVRARLHPEAQVRHAGLTAWRRTVPPGDARAAGLAPPTRSAPAPNEGSLDAPFCVTAFLHPRAHLVAYPMRGGALNAVAFTRTSGAPGSAGDREGLLAAFADAAPPLRALLAADGWGAWPLLLAPALSGWTFPRVALVGDAAHAIAPFAAQGAAMAVEDVVSLAEAATDEADAKRLRAWEAARRQRLARVEARGRLNRLAWHAAGPIALARNLVLRLRSPERLAAELDWLYGT